MPFRVLPLRLLPFLSLAAGAFVTAAACTTKDATGFLVTVDAQMPLSRVTLRVSGTDGRTDACHTYDLSTTGSPGTYTLPASLGLQPANPDAPSSVHVEAFAYRPPTVGDPCVDPEGSSPLLRTEAVVSYVAGATHDLPMVFSASCLGVTCASGETCRFGSCRPIGIDARTLPRHTRGRSDATTCNDLSGCTDVLELTPSPTSPCAFVSPDDDLPERASFYVRYTFGDGEPFVEALASTELTRNDARTVALVGGLCEGARAGNVTGVGVVRACGPLLEAPVCASSRAPFLDAVRKVAPTASDGGVDARPDATVADAADDAPSSDASDGSVTDATATDSGRDGSADDGGDGGADGSPDGRDAGSDAGHDASSDGSAEGGSSGDSGTFFDQPTHPRAVTSCASADCCGVCTDQGATKTCFEGFPFDPMPNAGESIATVGVSHAFALGLSAGTPSVLHLVEGTQPYAGLYSTQVPATAFALARMGTSIVVVSASLGVSTPRFDFWDGVESTSVAVGPPSYACTSSSTQSFERLVATDADSVYMLYSRNSTTSPGDVDWLFARFQKSGSPVCVPTVLPIKALPAGAVPFLLTAEGQRAMAAFSVAGEWRTAVADFVGANDAAWVDQQGPNDRAQEITAIAPRQASGGDSFLVVRNGGSGFGQARVWTTPANSGSSSTLLLSAVSSAPHTSVLERPGGAQPGEVVVSSATDARILAYTQVPVTMRVVTATGTSPRSLRSNPACVHWVDAPPGGPWTLRGAPWISTP